MKQFKAVAYIGALLFAVLTTGCTTTTIKPQTVQAPTETYHSIALGELGVSDPLWAAYPIDFRRGFEQRLREIGTLKPVDAVAASGSPDTILLTGRLTAVDKGSAIARVMVGMGAGRARVRGAFQIKKSDGVELASFEAGKAYSGGLGIGGASFLDMDDLMRKFGAETADAVVRWTNGQPLDQ